MNNKFTYEKKGLTFYPIRIEILRREWLWTFSLNNHMLWNFQAKINSFKSSLYVYIGCKRRHKIEVVNILSMFTLATFFFTSPGYLHVHELLWIQECFSSQYEFYKKKTTQLCFAKLDPINQCFAKFMKFYQQLIFIELFRHWHISSCRLPNSCLKHHTCNHEDIWNIFEYSLILNGRDIVL